MCSKPSWSFLIARQKTALLAAFLIGGAALTPHALKGQAAKAPTSLADSQDAVVFVGTIGQPGWRTDVTVGNPTQSPIEIFLSYDPNPPLCPLGLGCPAGVAIANAP